MFLTPSFFFVDDFSSDLDLKKQQVQLSISKRAKLLPDDAESDQNNSNSFMSNFLQRRNANRKLHRMEWKKTSWDHYNYRHANDSEIDENAHESQIFTVPIGSSVMSRTTAMLNNILSPPVTMNRTDALLRGLNGSSRTGNNTSSLSRTEMLLQGSGQTPSRTEMLLYNSVQNSSNIHYNTMRPAMSRTELALMSTTTTSNASHQLALKNTESADYRSSHDIRRIYQPQSLANYNPPIPAINDFNSRDALYPNQNFAHAGSYSGGHIANTNTASTINNANIRTNNANNKMNAADLFAMLKASGMLPT